MNPIFTDIVKQGAGAIIGGGMGMLAGGMNDERQRRQQEWLQQLQIKGQKEMSDYQFMKQLEMWEKTGYGAQVEQMSKAGINPALMYGMGGGGGQTTGGGGASVSGGTAPTGGGEIIGGMGMGIQSAMINAQMKLIEAQTKKTEAEANKTAGVDTKEAETRIESLWQGIDNARNQYELQKLEMTMKNMENYEKQATQEDRIDYIESTARIAAKQLGIIANEQQLSDAVLTDKIKIIRQEAIGAVLRNELTKTQTEVSKESIQKMAAEIAQGWEGLGIKERELKLSEIRTNFPGISQATGRILNDAVESIFKLTELNRGQHYKTEK